jgi:hypothetical protein
MALLSLPSILKVYKVVLCFATTVEATVLNIVMVMLDVLFFLNLNFEWPHYPS